LIEVWVFIVGLVLALSIAWSLGANDAANPTECAVGSGAITLRKAIALFSVFVALGALLQGHMVMKTLSRGIVPHIDPLAAFTVVLSIVLWLVLCTWKGIPVSTTHTTVGSVIGYGLIAYGANLNWGVLFKVFLGILLSPLLSLVCAALLYLGLRSLLGKFSSTRRMEQVVRYSLIGALAFSAYSFGANDVGNATGVYVSVTEEFVGLPTAETMLLLAALGSAGIALGGFTWGYRVIRTVGYSITRLTLTSGLAAELSNALVVWSFTTVPYVLFGWGLPISTTHSSVGAIIGVGLVTGLKTMGPRVIVKIVLTWVLTIPCVILISWSMFKLASVLITL
jgi:PiT family inorganic phosphate transporter